jgi:cytochrome c biogenesis protein CcmG/thiol:disulfide interchange protein DsbE
MTDKRKRVLMLLVLAVAFVSIYVAGRYGAGAAGHRGEMPDFELETVSSAAEITTAASFAKRPALVNVWASWCLACRIEHPLLMELAESGDIALYGVNYLDKREDAIRWLDYFGNPFELSAYDREGELGGQLGVEAVPVTFLIGRDGRILFGKIGPLDARTVEEEIWPRLASLEAGK